VKEITELEEFQICEKEAQERKWTGPFWRTTRGNERDGWMFVREMYVFMAEDLTEDIF